MHALQCAELAADARVPQVKASLLELSVNWEKLAREFEATELLLAQTDTAAAA
jgi:hypothetical protein